MILSATNSYCFATLIVNRDIMSPTLNINSTLFLFFVIYFWKLSIYSVAFLICLISFIYFMGCLTYFCTSTNY